MSQRQRQVVVAGGGMAGITAAVTLADAGVKVTLLEAGPQLGGRLATLGTLELAEGGRTYQFPLEHGIHGVWRQYRNLRRLLDAHGLSRALVPAERQELIFPTGQRDVGFVEIGQSMRESRLPDALASLALLTKPTFLRHAFGQGVLSYARVSADLLHSVAFDVGADVHRYDEHTVRDLIGRWPVVMQRMFSALTHSGFFAEASEVSLAAFLMGLALYSVGDKRDSAFDLFSVDTGKALFEPLAERIRAAGGEVILNARVTRVLHTQGRVTGVEYAGAQRVRASADAVVLALDAPAVRTLVDGGLPWQEGAAIPRGLPSAVVRLWFGRAPTEGTASTGVLAGFPADNFFWLDRHHRDFSRWRDEVGGGVLECHLYGNRATQALAEGDALVLSRVAAAAERIWPSLAGSLKHVHLQRNAATHPLFEPGTLARLPHVQGALDGLALCGDWIACDGQALYLERATTTGLLAAGTVAESLGVGSPVPTPLAPYLPAPSVAGLQPVLRRLRSMGLLPALRREEHAPGA